MCQQSHRSIFSVLFESSSHRAKCHSITPAEPRSSSAPWALAMDNKDSRTFPRYGPSHSSNTTMYLRYSIEIFTFTFRHCTHSQRSRHTTRMWTWNRKMDEQGTNAQQQIFPNHHGKTAQHRSTLRPTQDPRTNQILQELPLVVKTDWVLANGGGLLSHSASRDHRRANRAPNLRMNQTVMARMRKVVARRLRDLLLARAQ